MSTVVETWRSLLLRNLCFYSYSFTNTACIAVFPQHFFWQQRGTPSLPLSATLLGGALWAWLGVLTADRWGMGRLPRRWAQRLTALYMVGLVSCAAGWIDSMPGFIANQWGLSFLSAYLMQAMDWHSVRASGSAGRVDNDLMVSSLRFLGMLAAPLAFGFVVPEGTTAVMLVIVTACMAWPATLQLGERHTKVAPVSLPQPRTSTAQEWGLHAVALLIYSHYCVLASAAPYLVAQLVGQTHAVDWGWTLIAVVYASAFVASVLLQWRRRAPRLVKMLLAPITVLAISLAMGMDAARSAPVQIAGCMALGAAFACFLAAYRSALTLRALHDGRDDLIARFNQLPRQATLGAFVALTVIAWLTASDQFAAGLRSYLAWSSAAILVAGWAFVQRVHRDWT